MSRGSEDGGRLQPRRGLRAAGDRPGLGVVIPTLNEEGYLPALLSDLERICPARRVVVSDGGSVDRTRELARAAGAVVVSSPRGRGSQLNHGAGALDTPWLLFLHADTRVPPAAARALERWLDSPDPRIAAYFGFALDGDGGFWRFLELGQAIRERLYGLVYGDQGLLVSRKLFDEVGGYPDEPLMEDVAMVRKLRRAGRVERIPEALLTSPRRYEREGRVRGWLRNAALITLYLVGVPPRILRRWYPDEPGAGAPADGPGAGQALLVFARNPEPGRVKTRLASEIGADEAARVYGRMARAVVDEVRSGPYRVIVCFDPPDARREVAGWLDGDGLTLRPQVDGGMGERLSEAFDQAFRTAQRVCVIGTDAPGVDRELVEEAFRALDEADVVLGPAADGGYYLLAIARPVPDLFRDIPWSTSDVLDTTLERARDTGLTTTLLRTLSDVDTLADLREVTT